MSSATPGTGVDQYKVRHAALAGLVGTALEQYDFVIYATGTAIVFVARPLGGLFFSRYGDRLGRKWVLVATLFLMGFATLAIGLLPTHHQAGLLSPILLVCARVLQDFGAGAEQAGGVTLLAETAASSKRGFYCSFVFVGAALGSVLGALAWLLVECMPDEQLLAWGWRLVFISSIFVTIAAYVIRRKLQESPVFQETQTARIGTGRTPIGDVLHNGRPSLVRVFFINMGSNGQSYIYQVFMGSYLVTWLNVDAAFVPDLLLYGAIGAVIVIGFMLAGYGTVGSQGAFFAEMFGTRYRYAGISISREFSSVIGGGLAPLVSSALITWAAGSWWPVALYMMFMIGLSLIGAIMSPETRGRDLHLELDAVPSKHHVEATADTAQRN